MKKNLLLLSTLPIAFSLQAEKQQTRPNIVVFISDDASPDMGCYGINGIKTPTIDSLAASGVRFANAYLTAPQSSPSRTSMISGQFAHTINTEDLGDQMPNNVLCLPTYLRQLGYKTGVMLKDHMGANVNFEERIAGGYNKDGSGLWSTTVPAFGDFVERSGADPFFVWVGFIDPHRGYTRTMCPQVNPVEGVTVAPFLLDNAATRRDLADYYDEISRSDRDMKAMIQEIRKRGKLENTIFIYLSDNGFPFPRGKGSCYDAGVHTPLVISGAGIPSGKVHSNGLISTVELAPTILNLAGMDTVPKPMYGQSFKSIILDPTLKGREYVFSERNWHGGSQEYIRSVRSDKYKYIFNGRPEIPFTMPGEVNQSTSSTEIKSRLTSGTLTPAQALIYAPTKPEAELYDITIDPFELNNLVTTLPDVAAQLKTVLDNWQLVTKDKTPAEEMLKEALRTYKQQSVNILKNGEPVLNFEDLLPGDEIYAYASPADDEVLVSFTVGNETFTTSPAKLKVGSDVITTSAIFQKKNLFYKEGFGNKTIDGAITISTYTGYEYSNVTYTGDVSIHPTTGSVDVPTNAQLYFQNRTFNVAFNQPLKGTNLQLKMRIYPVQGGTSPNFLDTLDMGAIKILVNGKQIVRNNTTKVRYITPGKGIDVFTCPFTVLSLDTITTIKTLTISVNALPATSTNKMRVDDISIAGTASGINTAITEVKSKTTVTVFADNSGFYAKGLLVGSEVSVYDLSGRKLMSKRVDKNQMYFSNNHLYNGVYVLNGVDENNIAVRFKVLFN